jgi:SAM-dependent methyltransferase
MIPGCRPRIADECVCCGGRDLSKCPAVLMPFVAARVFGWEPVEITEAWHLRDIKLGMAYSVCNTLKCNACGLIFLDIRFDDAEMSALYRGYRDEYTDLRTRFEPDYGMRNQGLVAGYDYIPHVERFLRERIGRVGSVLDWGGDTGLNTPFRREVAVHHVFDISEKPAIEGAERVDAAEAMANEYDLVVVSQVLEHVAYPKSVVSEVAQTLAPNTALWVEVPNEAVIREAADPEYAYLEKRHWHEHINFFTAEALSRLLGGAGLRIQEHTTFAVSVGGETVHVRGALCRRGAGPGVQPESAL